MKRIQHLIRLDYEEHKKSLLLLYVSLSLLMILFSFTAAYDVRSQLYTYNESTKTYILTKAVASRPEESLSSICNPLMLQFFLIMSGFLSVFFTAKNYRDKSIYLISRLPQKRGIYLLSKYIPPFVLLVIGYLLCLIQTIVFYGMYQLMIPSQCIPVNCLSSYITSAKFTQCYPFARPSHLIALLLLGFLTPAIGLLIFEVPRMAGQAVHWINNKRSA